MATAAASDRDADARDLAARTAPCTNASSCLACAPPVRSSTVGLARRPGREGEHVHGADEGGVCDGRGTGSGRFTERDYASGILSERPHERPRPRVARGEARRQVRDAPPDAR